MSFRRGTHWKQMTRAAAAVVVTALVAVGCQQLDTQNPNAPSTEQLVTPGDVEGLINSAYLEYWSVAQMVWPGAMLSVGADHHSASWGNFGMKDFGSEPRWKGTGEPFDNRQTYTYAFANEFGWFTCYSGIVAATDALIALGEGSEGAKVDEPIAFTDPDRRARALAFSKFVQALCTGFLGMTYDKAYVVNEDVARFEGGSPVVLDFSPYDALVDEAVATLQEVAQISDDADFTTPSGWVNGVSLTSAELADLARSYIARFEASRARSPTEAMNNVNWTLVRDMAQQGITEDLVITANTADGFWGSLKGFTTGEHIVWSRLDMRQVGPADTSGNWEQWMATPVQQRGTDVNGNGSLDELDIFTPDERFPAPNGDGELVTGSTGFYLSYWDFVFFPPGRGTYHFSWYNDDRYDDYVFSCTQCWFGEIPEMTATEMDLLEAEAHIMLGSPNLAVPLIDATRTTNGGLPGLTTTGPGEPFPDCVPHDLQGDGTCGSLEEALYYEKGIEVFQVSAGLAYYDDRRWNLLVEGTPVHLPVPGLELETIETDLYSWGGVGQPGGAPAPSTSIGLAAASRASIDGGTAVYPRDRVLEQIAWDLEWIESRREALSQKFGTLQTQ